jgi:hypothetical protein
VNVSRIQTGISGTAIQQHALVVLLLAYVEATLTPGLPSITDVILNQLQVIFSGAMMTFAANNQKSN